MLTKAQRCEYAAWMGRRSYRARLDRLGLEKLQQIARANGRKGGRPPKRAKEAEAKSGQGN